MNNIENEVWVQLRYQDKMMYQIVRLPIQIIGELHSYFAWSEVTRKRKSS